MMRAIGALTLLSIMFVGVLLAACSSSPEVLGTESPEALPTSLAANPTPAPTGVGESPDSGAVRQPELADDPLLRLVDRDRPLNAAYEPSDLTAIAPRWTFGDRELQLVEQAASALSELLAAAASAGYEIKARSAYRSYSEQEATFEYWVQQLGEAQARRESAEAGLSEHQLGTTVDLTAAAVDWELVSQFAETGEGRWLRQEAGVYGFVLSYPEGSEGRTGFIFEPWHYRYVGPESASEFLSTQLVLVEWLALVDSDPD